MESKNLHIILKRFLKIVKKHRIMQKEIWNSINAIIFNITLTTQEDRPQGSNHQETWKTFSEFIKYI